MPKNIKPGMTKTKMPGMSAEEHQEMLKKNGMYGGKKK